MKASQQPSSLTSLLLGQAQLKLTTSIALRCQGLWLCVLRSCRMAQSTVIS